MNIWLLVIAWTLFGLFVGGTLITKTFFWKTNFRRDFLISLNWILGGLFAVYFVMAWSTLDISIAILAITMFVALVHAVFNNVEVPQSEIIYWERGGEIYKWSNSGRHYVAWPWRKVSFLPKERIDTDFADRIAIATRDSLTEDDGHSEALVEYKTTMQFLMPYTALLEYLKGKRERDGAHPDTIAQLRAIDATQDEKDEWYEFVLHLITTLVEATGKLPRGTKAIVRHLLGIITEPTHAMAQGVGHDLDRVEMLSPRKVRDASREQLFEQSFFVQAGFASVSVSNRGQENETSVVVPGTARFNLLLTEPKYPPTLAKAMTRPEEEKLAAFGEKLRAAGRVELPRLLMELGAEDPKFLESIYRHIALIDVARENPETQMVFTGSGGNNTEDLLRMIALQGQVGNRSEVDPDAEDGNDDTLDDESEDE